MVDVNQFMLVGRLANDIEIKEIKPDLFLCKFSVAVSDTRVAANGEKIKNTHFLEASTWCRQAGLYDHAKKGCQISCTGKLKQEKWVDKTTGANKSKMAIYVDNLMVIEKPNTQGVVVANPQTQTQDRVKYKPNNTFDQGDETANIFSNDLPF